MSDARSNRSAGAKRSVNPGADHAGQPDAIIALLTHVPDQALARQMATHLVEQGLAACVNILGACESIYRWQGKVETAGEIPLLIKTTWARYPEVEAAIIRLHPYDVPEIIVLGIEQGWPAYLDWIRSATAAA